MDERGERAVQVKYELYCEGREERVGKVDRVQVTLDSDPEIVAIAFREGVHERRKVRDLAHCSAANLRLFLESNPAEEFHDEDLFRFLINGARERIRVVAPPPPYKVQSLGTNRARSVNSAGRASSDFGGSIQGSTSRRESSKRGESEAVVVFVKTGDATFPIEVEKSSKVEAVKARIKEQEQIPLDQQRLIYGGVELESDRTLFEYNIQQGSELQLVLTLDPS